MLGWLVGNGKVALTVDANPVVRTEAAALIRNTGKQQHTVVAPQKAYDATKVAAFKKFCTDFFDEGAVPSDPTELARFGKDKLAAKRDELNALVSTSRYPFVSQLSGVVTLLDQVVGKPADWYLGDFDKADELIEAKEDLVDPIKSFLNGQQAKIFDEAQALLSANTGNLGYLPAGSADPVKTLLADPNAFRGNKMNQLKAASDTLAGQIDGKVSDERADVSAAIEGRKAEVLASAYYANATDRCAGERDPARRPDPRATRRRELRSRSSSRWARLRAGRSTRSCSTVSSRRSRVGGDDAAAEADGVVSRRSRSRASPASSNPKPTSTTTSPPCAPHSSRPSTTESESRSDGNRTAQVVRHLGAHRAHPRGRRADHRRARPGFAGARRAAEGRDRAGEGHRRRWRRRQGEGARRRQGRLHLVQPHHRAEVHGRQRLHRDRRGLARGRPGRPARGAGCGQARTGRQGRRSRAPNAATITGLLNGTRQPRPGVDAQAEAYSLLLADYCRFWNKAMPFMFEREGDYTELLIPANLLADDSVLSRSVTVLTEDVCQDVEVIGWLYQFYISERKDEVFAGFKKNKKAGADEIPAATQLFTPHWIVRYLVENSLGRLWMLNRPSSGLVSQMDYYIAPVDEETDFLKITKPEELKVIDPACGSGHMLTYAFDLLYAIYEEEGYAPSEIPGLILANNLYGTEIDPRAGALAAFALTMKAGAKRKLFLKKPGRAEHLRARPDLVQPRRTRLPRDQGRRPARGGGVLEPVRRGRHVRVAHPA